MSADDLPVSQECIEAYLYAEPPLELLLFRRPPGRGGIWVPVSGKVDPGDRDLDAAARRELAEETGLSGPYDLESLDFQARWTGSDGLPWRLSAYAVRVPRDFRPTLSSEHDRFEWVGPEAAIDRLHYVDNREAVRRLVGRRRTAERNV